MKALRTLKIANVKQMKAIDSISINEYGIEGIVLMENAGAAVAAEALRLDANNYAIVCGKGNNGGDGSVAARHIFNKGKNVTVYFVCEPDELKGDALTNYNILKKLNVKTIIGLNKDSLKHADVIIDALLGIGSIGAPYGEVEKAIVAINDSGKTVIAVDVPSGINCDTGAVMGVCVNADVTVTFGVNKIGLVCYPAAQYAGRVIVSEISFAPQAVERQNINVNITQGVVLPQRCPNSHKGSFGKVFALCGSTGYTGAAYLSSTAALKTGCGLVTLGIPFSLSNVMAQKLTEVMTTPLADINGQLSAKCIPVIDKSVENCNAIICGCGLGRGDDILDIVSHLLETANVPIVLDADGINALIGHKDILKSKNCDVIITPHIGEMSRLICKSIDDIQNNTAQVAKNFATEYTVVTVLKGANTVIAFPNGEVYINTNGNSGMATAGSGDVLAGVICSLVAQGQPPSLAAVNGVYIHGRAGDIAAKRLGEHGVMAGDILNSIPCAMHMLIPN